MDRFEFVAPDVAREIARIKASQIETLRRVVPFLEHAKRLHSVEWLGLPHNADLAPAADELAFVLTCADRGVDVSVGDLESVTRVLLWAIRAEITVMKQGPADGA